MLPHNPRKGMSGISFHPPEQLMLKSFLNFDEFVTPRIITVIYWLQIVAVALFSLMVMFLAGGRTIYLFSGGTSYQTGFSFGSFLAGIFIFVVGALMVRVMNELIIALFRIQEHLKAIREQK